jgi:UDP-3-O-[3-hydroxymyristoyl] glucosamine N-acyltransferase
MMRPTTTGEIRTLVGGELRGDEALRIERVTSLEQAGPDALSFVASPKYLPYLQATRAGAVLVAPQLSDRVPSGCTAIVVPDAHLALYQVLTELYSPGRPAAGIHPTAIVAATAEIAGDATVGPYAVVGEGVRIGARCVVGAHAVIGDRCTLAGDVVLHPHATLYPDVVVEERAEIHSGARIGKQGFGYVWKDGGHRKMPQIGGCRIEADVELGTNVTIDRGSVGDTVVGRGSKIDNLVHLGHNVHLGKHVILVSQVGISGSTSVGDGAILAGQAGIAGHLSIGVGARVGAQAGVISDVPAGETYSGYPARPHREAMRAQAGLFRLPGLLRRLKRLEEAVFGRDKDDGPG